MATLFAFRPLLAERCTVNQPASLRLRQKCPAAAPEATSSDCGAHRSDWTGRVHAASLALTFTEMGAIPSTGWTTEGEYV